MVLHLGGGLSQQGRALQGCRGEIMMDAFHDFLTESWKVAYSGNLEARLGSASELGSFLRVVLQEMEFRYATR